MTNAYCALPVIWYVCYCRLASTLGDMRLVCPRSSDQSGLCMADETRRRPNVVSSTNECI